VVHCNFRQQAVEAAPVPGALAAVPLVLVDNDDALGQPAEGGGVAGEGVLPLAGLAAFEDLLRR
jgi:hypothetical protein